MVAPSREQLIHRLYEAAELEHTLMCTYLYAAFSLKGPGDGLSEAETDAVVRWRQTIIKVAVEEMGHLAAVWNITAALGGAPRFGRRNFPLDPGMLPASIVVKLAPFSEAVIQHFIHLERPMDSVEPEGEGFAPVRQFVRGSDKPRLTPMAIDYDTVGVFYVTLEEGLREFVELHGERDAFCGDPALQLSQAEVPLDGARPVVCLKTALAALSAIVEQGEGAPGHSETSHFAKYAAIRSEYRALRAANPSFQPAFPAATNPVLRPPLQPEGRVWMEDEEAAQTVDLANTGYALMLRLIAYTYVVPRTSTEKALAVDLSLGLMRAVTFLGERAARMPAGPSNPHCNAGMSFTALRDAAAFPPGPSARRFFIERFDEVVALGASLDRGDARVAKAQRILADLAARARSGFTQVVTLPVVPEQAARPAPPAPPTTVTNGVEVVEGEHMTLMFEAGKCIHSRFCVTGAPDVFLANVQGPWIHPDAMDAELLAGIAHACPSGAIRYTRKDGRPDESAPPVNLVSIREAGPYAVRGDIKLDGKPAGFRATLCRCGASKHKPFCDSSHKAIPFTASGEPATKDDATDMLAVRNGPLAIDPQVDGPYQVRGNLEITSGTGRVVARVQTAKLCRCGGSSTKPFCDGTHVKIGFRSDR